MLTKGVDDEAAQTIADIRTHIDSTASDKNWDQDKLDAMQDELATMSQHLTAPSLVICDHGDELAIWQLSEILAKTFDVPLLDLCGNTLLERTPAQLNQPLREKLLGTKPIDTPKPAPLGYSIDRVQDEVKIRWRSGHDPLVIFIWVVATLLGIVAITMGGVGEWRLLALFAGASILLILAAVILPKSGRGDTLTITTTRVSYHPTRGQPQHLSMSDIEAVRVNTELQPYVGVMGDRQAFRCRTQSAREADWLGDTLTQAIARVGIESESPYR